MLKRLTLVCVSLSVVAVACSGKQGEAPKAAASGEYIDPAQVSPEVYSIMHDDEHVRILEMKLPAGASDAVHSHPYEAVYFIKGGKAQITLPDGNVVEKEIPDGGSMAHDAWTHSVKNIGDTDIHAIIVELKKTPPSAGAVGDDVDPIKVAGDVYRVLTESERVRMLEMTMAAGAEDVKHAHPFEAVYFITGGKAQITLPDGKQVEKEIPDGGIMAHEGWTHTVKNIGDSNIHAIIVEIKG